ncbi:ATP-grasp domain-containing protein, partial [Candidatus Microgenomates bacterium]|nr:ATP-grasp domain-containing protein [Candidatus Microgenomates bacterium]
GASRTARQEIEKIAEKFGYPMILKARFDAYDGRGNAVIRNAKGIEVALQKMR